MSEALKKRAEEIRDETKINANTAERVGGVILDIIIENDDTKMSLEGRQKALEDKLGEFMGLTYISSIELPSDGGGVKIGVKTICKEWEVQ